MAEFRIQADVSPNRALWHLDSYRDAARRVAAYAALREHHVRRTVVDGLSLMMMLNVPATAGLLVLAVPIVQ